jgi:hypothetical protein
MGEDRPPPAPIQGDNATTERHVPQKVTMVSEIKP